MKVLEKNRQKLRLIGVIMLAGFVFRVGGFSGVHVSAAESFGYFDEAGNWIEGVPGELEDLEMMDGESYEEPSLEVDTPETEAVKKTGSYKSAEGWSVDDFASTEEKTVYKLDGYVGTEGTSTIACSYLDTNYSVLEYEQLRDMLTNNLLYSNVNAQISASAVYTNAKDYLYILLVDDTSQDYRNIYCYAVGDYRCFCVEVKEYRAEAEALKSQGVKTPQETGQKIAESFVWNS